MNSEAKDQGPELVGRLIESLWDAMFFTLLGSLTPAQAAAIRKANSDPVIAEEMKRIMDPAAKQVAVAAMRELAERYLRSLRLEDLANEP